MKFYNGVLLLLFMAPSVLHAENGSYSISSNWSTKFNAYVTVNVQTPVVNGWTIVVNFDKPVQALEIWNADVSSSFDNKKVKIELNLPSQQSSKITPIPPPPPPTHTHTHPQGAKVIRLVGLKSDIKIAW